MWLPYTLGAFLLCTSVIGFESTFTPAHMKHLQVESKKLFQHAWKSYMDHGFPFDEVRPDTCEPYGPDYIDIDNTVRNDAMGNVSLTVLDNLDTLIIMEEWDELLTVLTYLRQNKDDFFNQDTIVQVFEMSIRSLGGLLSAHLLLTDVMNVPYSSSRFDKFKQVSDEYDGFLLTLAYDLGLRLIPSYKTTSNIPVPRINLAKGVKIVPNRFQTDACTAGAATPVLEFTLLSRLTGDPQFEHYTQLTFWKLWRSKLPLNLLPMTLDPIANQWKDSITGVGALVDSFYEYAAKASIVFDDSHMWSVFKTSYKALLQHLSQGGGDHDGSLIFPNVGTQDGVVFSSWIDLLSAFWPGVQVLTGQLNHAIKTHWVYVKIWNKFELIPERWAYTTNSKRALAEDAIQLEWYALRPEFIESTYYLYRATKDPMYLQIGVRVMDLLQTKFKAKCGFHGLQDVRTGKMQNRMETFVMSETLKYLYLLFDTNDRLFLHSPLMANKNWIFSTEAHPLWLSKRLDPLNKKKLRLEEAVHFDQPLYSRFWSIINRHENSKQKLIDSSDMSFLKNITLPLAPDTALPSAGDFDHVRKRDPFVAMFETCEVSPFKKSSTDFLSSGYYRWDQIFTADHDFIRTLVKPHYLSDSSLDGSSVELTRSFYDLHTMFLPSKNKLHLQCPRASTTKKYEVVFGDVKLVNQVEISELVYKDKSSLDPNTNYFVFEKDLWVPELVALKIAFETLVPGKIDVRNKEITQAYIESVRVDDYDPNGFTPKDKKIDTSLVLRVYKLNGVQVSTGSVIWTLPFEPIYGVRPNDPPLLDIASDGRVILEGKVIENIIVWQGS